MDGIDGKPGDAGRNRADRGLTAARRALAIACAMVDGSAREVAAEDADAVHDPAIAVILRMRAEFDPDLAARLAGRSGAWLDDVGPATPWMDEDEAIGDLAARLSAASDGIRDGATAD